MRRSTSELLVLIQQILAEHGTLTMRRIAHFARAHWRTVKNALETLAALGVVVEVTCTERRTGRYFQLASKHATFK